MAPAPQIPRNETARLDALARYDVLDTQREPAFDGLVELASHICGTPVALLSLVDENRQWFKAELGGNLRETPRDVAFCAHAILEPDTLMEVNDAREDARFHDNPLVTDDPGIRFYAGMPLLTDDGFALGTLCVIDDEPRQLDDEQRGMLALLAQQAVHQLERRRAQREAEDQSRLLQAVMDSVSAEIVCYDTTLETRLWNSVYDRNYRAMVGRRPRTGEPMRELIEERACKAGFSRAVVDDFLARRMAYHENPQGDLAVDLPNGSALLIREAPVPGWGVVATLVDVTPLRSAERALEERTRELELMARTDPLTGLANRRWFFETAEQERARSIRYRHPMSVLGLDIDHFKQVNDQHGHDVGDEVIRHVARLAVHSTRTEDLVARLGGEEFAILLPETEVASARVLAERIRSAIASSPVTTRAGRVNVTVSVGVDELRESDASVDDLLVRADALLYEAKRSGRNCVTTARMAV